MPNFQLKIVIVKTTIVNTLKSDATTIILSISTYSLIFLIYLFANSILTPFFLAKKLSPLGEHVFDYYAVSKFNIKKYRK